MDALNAWSTLALAVIAGIALLGARGQIQEARRLRKSTSRAYVTVHAEGDKETRTINLFVPTLAGPTLKTSRLHLSRLLRPRQIISITRRPRAFGNSQ
jgi:hypothetical protein